MSELTKGKSLSTRMQLLISSFEALAVPPPPPPISRSGYIPHFGPSTPSHHFAESINMIKSSSTQSVFRNPSNSISPPNRGAVVAPASQPILRSRASSQRSLHPVQLNLNPALNSTNLLSSSTPLPSSSVSSSSSSSSSSSVSSSVSSSSSSNNHSSSSVSVSSSSTSLFNPNPIFIPNPNPNLNPMSMPIPDSNPHRPPSPQENVNVSDTIPIALPAPSIIQDAPISSLATTLPLIVINPVSHSQDSPSTSLPEPVPPSLYAPTTTTTPGSAVTAFSLSDSSPLADTTASIATAARKPKRDRRVLFQAVARCAFQGVDDQEELSFPEKAIISVIEATPDPQSWWKGIYKKKMGHFPGDYVEKILPSREDWPEKPIGQFKIRHNFVGDPAENELSLTTGDVVDLFEKLEGGWCRGSCDGLVGYFPASFIDHAALQVNPLSPPLSPTEDLLLPPPADPLSSDLPHFSSLATEVATPTAVPPDATKFLDPSPRRNRRRSADRSRRRSVNYKSSLKAKSKSKSRSSSSSRSHSRSPTRARDEPPVSSHSLDEPPLSSRASSSSSRSPQRRSVTIKSPPVTPRNPAQIGPSTSAHRRSRSAAARPAVDFHKFDASTASTPMEMIATKPMLSHSKRESSSFTDIRRAYIESKSAHASAPSKSELPHHPLLGMRPAKIHIDRASSKRLALKDRSLSGSSLSQPVTTTTASPLVAPPSVPVPHKVSATPLPAKPVKKLSKKRDEQPPSFQIISSQRTTTEAMKKLGIFTQELWPPFYPPEILHNPDFPPLSVVDAPGWQVELGQPVDIYNQSLFTELTIPRNDLYQPLYAELFMDRAHYHYLLSPNHSEGKGPFLFSVLKQPIELSTSTRMLPVLIRSNKGVRLINISANENLPKSLIRICELQGVQSKCLVKYTNIPGSKIHQELIREERKRVDFSRGFGFGLLYAKDDQTESEIYSNCDISPAFATFMRLLADRDPIPLLGHKGLRAGLDVNESQCTGTQSLYTIFSQFEIMFHVGPFLPFDPLNEQQLPRKRHIGNDLVVVVFKEGPTPFNPAIMRSHMNQAILIVQEISYDDACTLVAQQGSDEHVHLAIPASSSSSAQTQPLFDLSKGTQYYRLAFCAKSGSPLATPLLLQPSIVSADSLRAIVLTKCINAHRNAFAGDEIAPIFRRMWSEQVISFQNLLL